MPRGDHDRGVGLPARRRRLRGAVGDGGACCARARPAGRPRPLPRAPVRGARGRPCSRAAGRLRLRGARVRRRDARLRRPDRLGAQGAPAAAERAAARRRARLAHRDVAAGSRGVRGGCRRPARTSSATRSTTRGHGTARLGRLSRQDGRVARRRRARAALAVVAATAPGARSPLPDSYRRRAATHKRSCSEFSTATPLDRDRSRVLACGQVGTEPGAPQP